ncbi:MAG: glycosyltransferase family 4 protein [Oscillospiraceae bacterium]|nr:glycosyltransferase family 4 protein [Oscillospiraceae bacterium]
MRVLHINCNYIGTKLHRTMFRLLDREGEHRVFIPSDGREAWKDFVPEKDEHVSVCFRRFDRYIYFKKQEQILKSVEQTWPVGEFDCIHAYTLFTDGNCAMRLSKKYGIPYVVAVRNTDVNGFFKRRWLLRPRGIRILKNASRVFFLSEEYRRILLEKYVPRALWDMVLEKSVIVPNGIDSFWIENPAPPLDEERLRAVESGRLRFLLVGRLMKYKNPLRTADAARELIRRGYDVHFTLVGKAEDAQMLEKLREDDFFTYLEPMPKEQLIRVYREHDLFVMPSTDETFGLVYPEALSQRLPVIYSVGEGFYGQFPEGAAGYGAAPRSTEDVVEKILLCLEHYREISARGPELAARFNWEKITGTYRQIYADVVGETGKGKR